MKGARTRGTSCKRRRGTRQHKVIHHSQLDTIPQTCSVQSGRDREQMVALPHSSNLSCTLPSPLPHRPPYTSYALASVPTAAFTEQTPTQPHPIPSHSSSPRPLIRVNDPAHYAISLLLNTHVTITLFIVLGSNTTDTQILISPSSSTPQARNGGLTRPTASPCCGCRRRRKWPCRSRFQRRRHLVDGRIP